MPIIAWALFFSSFKNRLYSFWYLVKEARSGGWGGCCRFLFVSFVCLFARRAQIDCTLIPFFDSSAAGIAGTGGGRVISCHSSAGRLTFASADVSSAFSVSPPPPPPCCRLTPLTAGNLTAEVGRPVRILRNRNVAGRSESERPGGVDWFYGRRMRRGLEIAGHLRN